MLDQLFAYMAGSKLIIGIIGITVVLFIAAIIRYMFDRSGGYF